MAVQYGWRLWVCGVLIGAWCLGCRPKVPPQPGAGAGSRLSLQIRSRSCPNELAFAPDAPGQSRFSGGVCKLSDPLHACSKRCMPFGGAGQIGPASDDFFADCGQAGVLCVGADFATKDLNAAAAKVAADSTISRILLASGRYVGGVAFANIQRALTIEGRSNDPNEGVVIEGPSWEGGALPISAAALSFKKVTSVVLRRLVVIGGRHGIVMEGVAQAGIDGVIATRNVGYGLYMRDVEKADISRSEFSSNGLARDGRITATAPCRYGVALEAVEAVVIETSYFLGNGAGGLRVGPGSLVSASGPCERVRLGEGVQVPVTTGQSLRLASNLFSHNGPLGWSPPGPDDGSCDSTTCGDGSFCERGRCVPLLRKQETDGTLSLVGVGAAIAGVGKVTLVGNGIHENDAAGLLLHSATQVQFQENAIAANGLRRGATSAGLARFATAAVQLWRVLQATVIHNLIIDNAATGLRIAFATDSRQRSLELLSNHIGGNGRFVELAPDNAAAGLVIAAPKSGRIVAEVSANFIGANASAGLRVSGGLLLTMEGNYLEYQLGAGAVFTDLGAGKASVFSLSRNTVKGARAVGLSFRGGASRVLLDANLIKEIRATKSEPDSATADGIQLIDLTGEPGVLTNNKVDGEWLEGEDQTVHQARAGIVLHNSRASLENNGFAHVKNRIVVQGGGELLSATETQILRPSAPLPLDKP